jgi:hypothetical protein
LKAISGEEAKKLIDRDADVILLDIRSLLSVKNAADQPLLHHNYRTLDTKMSIMAKVVL